MNGGKTILRNWEKNSKTQDNEICLYLPKKKYLKLTDSETKNVSQSLQKLVFLNNSKLDKAPGNNQVSPRIMHLTAFCHGGLCWSNLNWGSSYNFKTMTISKADTVSNCTDITINPKTTDWVPEEIISISTPGFSNSMSVKCTISRTIDFFFLKKMEPPYSRLEPMLSL